LPESNQLLSEPCPPGVDSQQFRTVLDINPTALLVLTSIVFKMGVVFMLIKQEVNHGTAAASNCWYGEK
jgi:hypothetical protein